MPMPTPPLYNCIKRALYEQKMIKACSGGTSDFKNFHFVIKNPNFEYFQIFAGIKSEIWIKVFTIDNSFYNGHLDMILYT